MLRPSDWLDSLGADEGETIYFALPEMGIEGPAVVEDIEPCPDIEDGPGRVVLATTESRSTRAVQLEFEGQDAPLVATAPHRFYSEDQDAWVPARKLRAGEHLRTQTGTLTLKSVQPKPGTYRVYNLEVETDHCYFVTDDAVLTHNTNPCAAPGGGGLLRQRMGDPPSHMTKPQAHHEFPQEFIDKFRRAGFDINDPKYGKWVEGSPVGTHQNWSKEYNDKWREFFEMHKNPKPEDILQKLDELRQIGKYK